MLNVNLIYGNAGTRYTKFLVQFNYLYFVFQKSIQPSFFLPLYKLLNTIQVFFLPPEGKNNANTTSKLRQWSLMFNYVP